MLIILVGMVLLLVGIQHYLTKNRRRYEMDDTDNERFRNQIQNDSNVISPYNLFSKFFSDEEPDSQPSVPRFFQGEGRNKSSQQNRHSHRYSPFDNFHK